MNFNHDPTVPERTRNKGTNDDTQTPHGHPPNAVTESGHTSTEQLQQNHLTSEDIYALTATTAAAATKWMDPAQ